MTPSRGAVDGPQTRETGYHAVRWNEPVLYELSVKGTRNRIVPETESEILSAVGDVVERIPRSIRRKTPLNLPEVAEPIIMRHYLRLSQETYGADSGVSIGLGTCTMKYSPKVNDRLVKLPGLALLHPLQPEETIQGVLKIMYGLRTWLCDLSGMDEFSFQPRSGAHGVFTNACMIRAYHEARGDHRKDEIITCAVSHPSNAGCPAAAGFRVITLFPDAATGDIGLHALKSAISERTAGLMITAPYDTGVFDSQLSEYIEAVHEVGGLVSLDQANFNGVMTKVRAGDLGADLMHFNLHKTFSTPHGSSGPGSGAVGVREELRRFLPVPIVEFDGSRYTLQYELRDSIGKVGSFYGVVMNVVRAYAWIMSLGAEGLRETAEWAVINSNYLLKRLAEIRGVDVPWPDRRKLQEARLSLESLKRETGVGSSEFRQRMADYGLQTFFESHEPRIIPEPVTPEATESASKRDVDMFVDAFRAVSEEAYSEPEIVMSAPHRCSVHKIDPGRLQSSERLSFTWRGYKEKR